MATPPTAPARTKIVAAISSTDRRGWADSTSRGSVVRVLFWSVIQRPCGMAPPLATVAATRAIWNGDATTCPCPYEDCGSGRSEEHTSELQSLRHLVCRLLLEKK